MEREKKGRQDKVGFVAADPDNQGEHKVPRAEVRSVQVERVCPFCRV